MISHVAFVSPESVLAIRQSLPQREHLFNSIALRQSYPGSAHHATRSIFLRGPLLPLENVEGWFADTPHVNYLYLDEWPEMTRLVRELSQFTGPKLGKVMLVELPPLSGIDWHVDQGDYSDAHDRYHLALETPSHGEAKLYSGGDVASVVTGEIVRFDTNVLHSAANHSPSQRRLHLIVDARK